MNLNLNKAALLSHLDYPANTVKTKLNRNSCIKLVYCYCDLQNEIAEATLVNAIQH